MIYEYACKTCNHEFEVIKRVAEYQTPEACTECSGETKKLVSKNTSFYGATDWDTAHYNPAFGKVMKSNKHAKQEAKRLGMDEIGNESVERVHKKFDDAREEKRSKSYDDICSTNLGELKA